MIFGAGKRSPLEICLEPEKSGAGFGLNCLVLGSAMGDAKKTVMCLSKRRLG